MTFYIQDSSFLTTRLLHDNYGLQKLDKAAKFLRKGENEVRGKFFYLQFGSTDNHLRHAQIIMHSRI